MKFRYQLLAIAMMFACVSLAPAQSSSQSSSQTTPASSTPADTPSLAPPEHPATPDQIREYFSLTHAVQTAHREMASMLKASRATSAPYFTASFWDDMEKAIMEIDMVEPSIPAYQKYFSQEDMAATIAFYKSPAGKRLLEAQPFITSAASDVLREIGRKAGQEVGLKHQAEIQKLMQQQSQPAQITLPPDK